MGSSFIINKSMLKKNGKKLMLDFFNSIHDEYMLTFDEIKSQRKFYDENILSKYKNIILENKKIYKYIDSFAVVNNDNKFLGGSVLNDEQLLKYIEDKIKNKTIKLKFVYEFLDKMDEKLNLDSKLEFEIDEDLLCLKKSFLKAYELFHFDGYILED